MAKSVIYSGIFLDEQSRTRLLNFISSREYFPANWDILADHCTICLGPIPDKYREHNFKIGSTRQMVVSHVGWSDGVFAVKLENGYTIDQRTPHITVFVDRKNGFKPKDANKITEWESIKPHWIILNGVIKEITN